MSNTTYSIKYDSNSFFSSNPNLDITFPFDVSGVVKWAKQTSPNLDSEYDTDNLFDEKLSDVIISNKEIFIKNFLVGNAYFNNDFDPYTLYPVQEPSSTLSLSKEFTGTSSDGGSTTFQGTEIKSRNGSTSYVIGTKGLQRVNFQPSCTLNHMHFQGVNGCRVQEITNSQQETYYKCVCDGTPVFDSTPHAHCSEFTNNIQNSQLAYNTAYYNIDEVNKNMDALKQKYNQGNSDGSGGAVDFVYENSEDLKRFNLSIRAIIYEYYKAVNQNVEYRDTIEKRQKSIDTQELALTDSTVKYKKEYLTAFNLLSGIIVVCGYIYGMNKV
jgi:hypothetical protein